MLIGMRRDLVGPGPAEQQRPEHLQRRWLIARVTGSSAGRGDRLPKKIGTPNEQQPEGERDKNIGQERASASPGP